MDDDVTEYDLFGSDEEEEETVPAPPSYLTWLPDDNIDRIFQFVLRQYTANQVCRRLIWLYYVLYLDAEDGGGDRLWRYGLRVGAPGGCRTHCQADEGMVERDV